MASSFNKLTNKSVNFDWTPECQTSFDCLKNGLVLAPVLAYPEFKSLFHLYVDASQTSGTRFDRKLLPSAKRKVHGSPCRGMISSVSRRAIVTTYVFLRGRFPAI